MTARSGREPFGLKTLSLRRRVTVFTLVVLAVVLIAVIVTVNLVLSNTLLGDLKTRLADRAGYAVLLEQQGVNGQSLADKLAGAGVFSMFTSGSQQYVGHDQGLPPGPPGRPPGNGGPPRPAVAPTIAYSQTDGDVVATVTLPAGQLTLRASTADIDRTMSELIRIEWFAGGGILLAAALVVVRLIGTALKPLRRMTDLARTIAAGARGRRLMPTKPRTDLGQAAQAFDAMLDALEAAEEQARAAENRMRQFLADASHDLRTPLAGVLAGSEQLLRAGPGSRAELEERLVAVIRQGRRAARLVDDLVLMTRLSGADAPVSAPQPVDLADVVVVEADGLALRRPDLRIVREFDLESDSAVVIADRDGLHRAVANLLDNAAAVSPPAGLVRLTVETDGITATLTVRDSGPGVPAEQRERIFDRFVRLDQARSGSGSGLGLPISRALLRVAGGDVRCRDGDGVGACFEARLPLLRPSAARIEKPVLTYR